MMSASPLLEVSRLSVRFNTARGEVRAVNDIGFSVARGETLGIVGESGSGKSQSLLALLGLLPRNANLSGTAIFEGEDLLRLSRRQFDETRGHRISMIFQDPMTALNPYLSVERQISEILCHHLGMSRSDARQRSLDMLRRLHIPDAERLLDRYPHQLSGGMRQRIVIAMALIAQPSLLLADEPTTALDTTIQAEILSLLAETCQTGTTLILVSHDIGVIARVCDRVAVMYAGRIVETGATIEVLRSPRHPYTRALLAAIPRAYGNELGRLPEAIEGHPPDPIDLPEGCAFAPRCGMAASPCHSEVPRLRNFAAEVDVACHLVEG